MLNCENALLLCCPANMLGKWPADPLRNKKKHYIASGCNRAGSASNRKRTQADVRKSIKNARARGRGRARARGQESNPTPLNATKRYFSYPTPPNATEATGKRERAWARTGMVAQPHDTEHHRTPPKATERERTAPNESKRQQTPANAK